MSVVFGKTAQDGIKKGVDTLANAVKETLGPRGRNVILEHDFMSPTITKDGVSVAKSIQLVDPLERIGCDIVRNVAIKTNNEAGDGTTTATVLAQAIYNGGLKKIAEGAHLISIKKGIDKAVSVIVETLKEMSEDVGEKIEQVATISANNDTELGKLIAKAFNVVGKEGVVAVETSKTHETVVEEVEGFQFDRGYVSPYFITDSKKQVAEVDNPFLLFVGDEIKSFNELIPIFKQIQPTGRPLVIVGSKMEDVVVQDIIINRSSGAVNAFVVNSPGFGDSGKEQTKDIAAKTGGVVILKDEGISLSNINSSVLGEADKVVISSTHTTIFGGKDTTERQEVIREQIKTAEGRDKEELENRLARLQGKVAILKVGGYSELEVQEKKDRVEDALNATKAAMQEGIVGGGGTALLNTLQYFNLTVDNEDEQAGVDVVLEAIEYPLRQITANAGVDSDEVIAAVLETGLGFDAKTEQYVDMKASGIIDPVKVTRVALENAASIAGMLLTTSCVITRDKQ